MAAAAAAGARSRDTSCFSFLRRCPCLGRTKGLVPPPVRLAVTDLDGTLLDSQGKVRAETLEMLKKVVSPSCPLCIATARGANENVPWECMPGPLYLLCMGGAHCLERVEGKDGQKSSLREVFLFPLPKADAADCVRESEALDATVLVMQKDDIWVKRGNVGWKEMEYFTGKAGTTALVKETGDLTSILAQDRTISIVTTMPNQEEGAQKLKKALLPDKVEVFAMTPDPLISLKAAGVDKETGLLKLFDHIKVTKEQVIAFGDGGNDVPMLKLAGIGVAVANAGAKAKAAADRVSEWSNDQDAVGRELLALRAAGRL